MGKKTVFRTSYYCKLLFIFFSFQIASATLLAQNYGLKKPQDPVTLPKSNAALQKSIRTDKQAAKTVLVRSGINEFLISGGWELSSASTVDLTPAGISSEGVNTEQWYNATVPGTVLTTLVGQGVYPDPYWGINNLSIPDTLCRQNWWYRTRFKVPAGCGDKRCRLRFNGINYAAEIWLNGNKIGEMKGAFKRGDFDVSSFLKKDGENVLAVLIIPPLHPGIPHEESPSAGTGPNGGQLCLDGPTFISSEGWDWIPGIRDRNIGLWQDVRLHFSGSVLIGDPQVIADLPLPDTSSADILIKTTLINQSQTSREVTVFAAFEGVSLSSKVRIAGGEKKEIIFDPSGYPQLRLKKPRLWWPNGYGMPELYDLSLSVKENNILSDSKKVKFGIRELSYELTVDAAVEKDCRIEFNPIDAFSKVHKPLFDNVNRRKVEGETFIPSLQKDIDLSMFKRLSDKSVSPYLVIKVNGRRIFCKGGNWGMDDGMKRVSRERLEPYFKLHRQAHFNMIRNWTGESTEEVFYDLCDEYGLLVWNDFWLSTERYNLNPIDNALFLSNAEDVILRFRNHPSIALWCPRNEGYAPAKLENDLAELVAVKDGTRHYQPNSRYLNLRTSGPWHYQKDPGVYFTNIADGFSTELGTPSVPSASSIRKMMAEEDVWPIGDVWYYHDFHDGQKSYIKAIDSLYGSADNLDDFCKKAQLVNYDSHRAMFESWNSRLWNKSSGLLLWMTHPAWPSTVWQVYSSDYGTSGSYFASQKACEPVHIQMNPVDNKVVAVNTSLEQISGASATLTVFDIHGNIICRQEGVKDIQDNQLTGFFTAILPETLPAIYLCRLVLKSSTGGILSLNDYWKSGESKDFRQFNNIGESHLRGTMGKITKDRVEFELVNDSDVPCLYINTAIQNSSGKQNILPAYYSEGYFNLLPGEHRKLSCSFDAKDVADFRIVASGYNLREAGLMNFSVK